MRSFYQQGSVLLLLLTACARRDRPYVPAAPTPDPAATRVIHGADGRDRFAGDARRYLIDAPGRTPFRELYPILEAIAGGIGDFEVEILVDTISGEGVVPFRLPIAGGVGYVEQGVVHKLWTDERTPGSPGVWVRVGQEGAYEVLSTGGAFPRSVRPNPSLSSFLKGPPPALEDARYILLQVEPTDLLLDIVQAIAALERKCPGKVVIDLAP